MHGFSSETLEERTEDSGIYRMLKTETLHFYIHWNYYVKNEEILWQQKKQTTTTKKSVYNQQTCPIRIAESSLLATQFLATQTLCDPMDCSLLGFSAQGIFQARTLEWVAISFPRESSQPRDQTQVSHIAGRLLTIWATREPLKVPSVQFSSVQSVMSNSATPWIAACQASLSITNSLSSPKLMSIEFVMLSRHLILCHPLLLLHPITSSIRVFFNESTLHMRWPKYWSFNFSISPPKEHPEMISFRMDWLDRLAV